MGACHVGNSNARVCPEGAQYVEKKMEGGPKIAIMACEGGCIKGEVARVAANMVAYQRAREETIRICLGEAMTGESGFRTIIERAPRVLVIEGCFLHCGTKMMQMCFPNFSPSIVEAATLYDFDREKYFEIFDLPREQIESFAVQVAAHVQELLAEKLE
nr:putative zinc-binding protein [uncultured Anaeromusa sp.]